MGSHAQKRMFFARMVIALAALTSVTARGQLAGAGEPKRPSHVALPQDARESAPVLHPTVSKTDDAERATVSSLPKRPINSLATTPGSSLSFLPAVLYDSGGTSPLSVVAADVNGDGKLDVIVANSVSGTVGVLLGNGDGTFLPVVLYSSGGLRAESIVAADLNGDGKLDLVVASCVPSGSNCGSGLVGVLLGNGDGTFQPAVTYSTGPFSATAVAVADLNGDGKPDLIAINTVSTFGLGVLLGNGDGTFQPVVTTNFNGTASSIATADVNGDGKMDVVMVACVISGTSCASRPSVLLGNGDG